MVISIIQTWSYSSADTSLSRGPFLTGDTPGDWVDGESSTSPDDQDRPVPGAPGVGVVFGRSERELILGGTPFKSGETGDNGSRIEVSDVSETTSP